MDPIRPPMEIAIRNFSRSVEEKSVRIVVVKVARTIPKIPKKLPCLDDSCLDNPLRARMKQKELRKYPP
jgi:hypothetical protein